jgi:hypothetical protein
MKTVYPVGRPQKICKGEINAYEDGRSPEFGLLGFRNGVPEVSVFLAYDAVSQCSCVERSGTDCPLSRPIPEEVKPKPGGTLVLTTATMGLTMLFNPVFWNSFSQLYI